jgi:hypothetical protein
LYIRNKICQIIGRRHKEEKGEKLEKYIQKKAPIPEIQEIMGARSGWR